MLAWHGADDTILGERDIAVDASSRKLVCSGTMWTKFPQAAQHTERGAIGLYSAFIGVRPCIAVLPREEEVTPS